jgi:G3E family GTPase
MSDVPAAPPSLEVVWDRVLSTLGDPRPDPGGIPHRDEIPVTVFAGFLGSGKTTLLCDLLQQTDLKILAIVNDLAALNVDAERIRKTSTETIEFDNGCACCVLGSDLAETLRAVQQRIRKPDAIVIEASGVSDPTGIAQTVAHVDGFILDGIITLVDALGWSEQLMGPAHALFLRQLQAAHLVILSKTDGDNAPVLEALTSEVARHVPGRAILPSTALQAHDLAEMLLGASARSARLPVAQRPHDLSVFESHVLELGSALTAQALTGWLDSMPTFVLRVKGRVKVVDEDAVVSVQSVGRRWRLTACEDPVKSGGSLVLIGLGKAGGLEQFANELERGL